MKDKMIRAFLVSTSIVFYCCVDLASNDGESSTGPSGTACATVETCTSKFVTDSIVPNKGNDLAGDVYSVAFKDEDISEIEFNLNDTATFSFSGTISVYFTTHIPFLDSIPLFQWEVQNSSKFKLKFGDNLHLDEEAIDPEMSFKCNLVFQASGADLYLMIRGVIITTGDEPKLNFKSLQSSKYIFGIQKYYFDGNFDYDNSNNISESGGSLIIFEQGSGFYKRFPSGQERIILAPFVRTPHPLFITQVHENDIESFYHPSDNTYVIDAYTLNIDTTTSPSTYVSGPKAGSIVIPKKQITRLEEIL